MSKVFFLCVLMLSFSTVYAEDRPQVLGYGVKACSDYLDAYNGREQGDGIAGVEYLRFNSWVAGMTTGLSLATNIDLLRGTDLPTVMRRLRIRCEDNPEDDLFTAATELLKLISNLE